VLGLAPGAEPREVRRSYLERKAIYASDSTATYTLLEDDERATLLERIEEAYLRITGTPAPQGGPRLIKEELPAAPSGPPPDAKKAPGGHLRHHRLRRGILLSEVADEIKVRSSVLEKIEQEDVDSLPASVYVRGFVVQYAKFLGLPDPEGVAASYLERMRGEPEES
jgi:flagellar biosynthesis protein FlhG